MTKDELLKNIEENTMGPRCWGKIMDAIDAYTAAILQQHDIRNSLPLTEEKKLELILRKYHGHTKEQWENELVKKYPYCEIPSLVEIVWNEAHGNDL